MDIKEIIKEIKIKTDARGGLKRVYFVACGGSQAAIYPAKYLLDSEAKELSVKIYNSGEFVSAPPKALDGRTLVICCSLKATPETVEAVRAANMSGAVSIAMTGSNETEMARVGQYVVVYSNGNEQVYSCSNQSMVLRLAFEILHVFEGYNFYEQAMAAYGSIDELVSSCKKDMLPAARRFAEDFKEDEIFYVLGSGPLYGTVYTMANCHLLEMQCRHAVMIHSGEYFHGPFETTNKSLPIILLKSVGRTRTLDERVERFLKRYAGRVVVIDAKQTGLTEAMDPRVAEYFNPVIMTPIERFFISVLADFRHRSMDDRNYMWKCEY